MTTSANYPPKLQITIDTLKTSKHILDQQLAMCLSTSKQRECKALCCQIKIGDTFKSIPKLRARYTFIDNNTQLSVVFEFVIRGLRFAHLLHYNRTNLRVVFYLSL